VLGLTGNWQRIVSDSLGRWTSRVVEIRERAIEVQQGRDSKLVATAFGKWVAAYHRRAEDVRLANSFKDVKREGERKWKPVPLRVVPNC
jgi:hypothetical protein